MPNRSMPGSCRVLFHCGLPSFSKGFTLSSFDSDLEQCYPSLVTATTSLIRRSRSLRHRADEAWDLVNDVIAALLDKHGPHMGHDPARGSLGAYLNGCIREYWLWTARRSWRKSVHRQAPTDPVPDRREERQPQTQLEGLDVDPLLVAHHVEGRSWVEIAEATNARPATVRQRASRAAKKLRQRVTSEAVTAESK